MTTENKELTLDIPSNKVADKAEENPDGADSEKEEVEPLTMNQFMYPENKYAVIQKRWGSFTIATLPFYLINLFFAVYGVDQYADIEGRLLCPGKTNWKDSVAVYNFGIGITVVYHSLEFMR